MTTARPVITRGASPVQGLVRIVLVDDHAILRQGLRSVLERESDLEIVGEASSLAEALAVVDKVGPDIVLMDLKLSASSDYEGLTCVASCPRRIPASDCWFSPRFSTINWWCERCTRVLAAMSSKTSTPPNWCVRSGRSRGVRVRSIRAARQLSCDRSMGSRRRKND